MIFFATFFDINYLDRGLVLYDSLLKTKCEFELFILALDDQTIDFFDENRLIFTNVTVVQLEEITSYDSDLSRVKSDRSTVEFYFTLSPVLPLYLLSKYNLPHICTLDADMYFYSSPQRYFDLLENIDIVLTPHKFSESNVSKLIYGKYNVSFQIFKNGGVALKFLNDWRLLCIEWCSDFLEVENDRFADQLYLNRLAVKYSSRIFENYDCVGGLALWNVSSFNIEIKNGRSLSNNEEIIFYHFHGFKFLNKHIITTSFKQCHVSINKSISKIYNDYWNSLKMVQEKYNISPSHGLRNVNNLSIFKKIIESESFAFKIVNKTFFFEFEKLPISIRQLIKVLSNVL